MKKRQVALALVAMMTLGVGVSMNLDANAAVTLDSTTQPQILQATQHKLEHAKTRIHNLEKRRAYLHRYIQHLRQRFTAPVTHTTSTTSAPAASSTPSYSGGVLTDAQVASYLRAAGFPESAIPQMLYYSHRESGNNPGAINSSSGACGLFQIYPAQPNCTDPATNARLAYQKYAASGFAPWGG